MQRHRFHFELGEQEIPVRRASNRSRKRVFRAMWNGTQAETETGDPAEGRARLQRDDHAGLVGREPDRSPRDADTGRIIGDGHFRDQRHPSPLQRGFLVCRDRNPKVSKVGGRQRVKEGELKLIERGRNRLVGCKNRELLHKLPFADAPPIVGRQHAINRRRQRMPFPRRHSGFNRMDFHRQAPARARRNNQRAQPAPKPPAHAGPAAQSGWNSKHKFQRSKRGIIFTGIKNFCRPIPVRG